MPSPFPGMNPYLENPELWTEVHHRLISAIADGIELNLPSQYRVAIEKRIYLCDGETQNLVGIPDVAVSTPTPPQRETSSVATLPSREEATQVTIPMPEEAREGYLEIRDVATGAVITVIEVLSPSNKRTGVGREQYEKKRLEVLASPAHLIEIDLLRTGKPMPIVEKIPKTDYRILIARSDCRPRAQLYAFSLRQPIPSFSIPLRSGDIEPRLNLHDLLSGIYRRSRLEPILNYNLEPVP
ncbi:MAG: DUF4058 family protein, partial [Cyanobacteriota bacterium]|nr:DUF4058 family protein [Cyanobacteriota bacterium]